jgi:hypothetical protein
MSTCPGIIRVASISTITIFLPLNSYLASANPASEEKKSCTTTDVQVMKKLLTM